MELMDFLMELAQFEDTVGKLYQRFADQLKEDPEAAELFRQLSREEADHRDAVRELLRMARLYLQIDGMTLPLDQESSRAAIEEVTAVLLDDGAVDLPEMLSRAYWTEEFALEKHSALILASIPSLGRMLESLRDGDRNHSVVIKEFAAARGVTL